MAVYFSGFNFKNESRLFQDSQSAIYECLQWGEYDVIGFSYGAQKAVEYAIECSSPIRKLCLLSPAFFHNLDIQAKTKELLLFKDNPSVYLNAFLRNALSPTKKQRQNIERYFCQSVSPSLEHDLHNLLFYEFNKNDFRMLINRGITIEVFLGSADRIISAKAAKDFFLPLVTRIFWIHKAGHFLLNPICKS